MDTTISPVIVPYSGAIPGVVRDGMEIEVEGIIPHHAHHGFSVNLCQGPQLEPTTLLHFNVRLSEHCVVLNHMHHDSWGSEERKSDVQFHKGKPFDLRVIVKPEMYKLKVNGHHIGDFAHRLPKELGQFMVIKGDVSINYLRFHSAGGGHHDGGFVPPPAGGYIPPPAGSYIPPPPSDCIPPPPGDYIPPPAGAAFPPPFAPFPTGPVAPPPPSFAPEPIFHPPVPFLTAIPGGLSPGRMISISGSPFPEARRFTINLQSATSDGCDVAFHFDVRFHMYDGTVNTIVRNHFQEGSWGTEERAVSYFPFTPNASFDILILTESHGFKVAVNNQHLLEFHHRLPIQAASTLHVTGDVRLMQVRFQ